MLPELDTMLRIAEIVSILGGGSVVAFRLGRVTQRVEQEISTLKDEIKTLSKLITEVAVQNTRLDSQDKRLDALDRTIEDLRRGEGMILPLANYLRPANK